MRLTSKQENRNVPRSAAEITADALACLEEGATIVHNHVDLVMVDGPAAAACYLESWEPVWRKVPGALLYPTVNAGPVEMQLFSSAFACRRRLQNRNHRCGLCKSRQFRLRELQLRHRSPASSLRGKPTGAEHGHLRARIPEEGVAVVPTRPAPCGDNAQALFRSGVQYLGGVFGLPPTEPALDAYLSILRDCPLPWSVAVMGDDVVDSAVGRLAVERGGHLHVGLEDWASICPRQSGCSLPEHGLFV